MFSSLSHFLQCATDQWSGEELVRKFTLPNDETISCVLWNGMHFISGADIVKVVCFQYMEATNRPINSLKKFEEGIFSDLRSLKPGVHATLEEAKSPFLMYLYKEGCVRTQKKQKVFIWNSVNFEKL
ncbi:transcription factor, STE-like protein, partial [Rozella allomycis CSF55]